MSKLFQICVIDDNDIDLEIATMGLEDISEHITLYKSRSFEDLDEVNINTIDLVICDLNLVGESLEETLERLNNIFKSSIKIVMSGVEPVRLTELKESYNFTCFIKKDDIIETLSQRVVDLLQIEKG